MTYRTETTSPLARTWQASSPAPSTMPQRSRGVIKAPALEAATHRVCPSDIPASRDLDSRTAAHDHARTVALEHHKGTPPSSSRGQLRLPY